jgi:signal transduction histidine kinase/CheY-like chemotaxis protein/CHASE3 domain sensor protein
MWLRRSRSLRKRAAFLVGTATLAVLCLVAAIGTLDWINRDASARAENGRQVQLDLDIFELGMVNQETGLRGYALTGRTQFLEPYDTGRGQVATAQRALDRAVLDSAGRSKLAELVATASAWQAYAEDRRQMLTARGGPDPAGTDDGRRLFESYRAADQSFDQYLDYRARLDLRAARDSSSFAAIATPVLGALILLLIVFLGLLVVRSILGPVSRLAAAARAVSRGESTSIPGRARRDELGALADALQAWQEESVKRLGLAQAMVDVNSHLRLDECLDLGIRRAAEVLGADEVTVLLVREGGFEITSDGRRSPLDSISAWIERGAAMQTVLNGKPTIGSYSDASWGIPTRSWASARGYGPVLAVPMVSRSVTVGALTATRLAGRAEFQDSDAQVAQIIAGPLAAAVNVAQVFEQKERQARTLAILNESGRAASGVLDPAELARVVADKAVELLGGHHATLSWLDPADGLLHIVAENHPRPVGDVAFGPGEGAAGMAFETAQPVLVEDYQAWARGHDWAARRGAKSVVAVPLIANDMPVGALSVHTETVHRFSQEDIQRLSLLAGQVAPAMQAASLHSQLTRANEELTRVSNHKSRFLANMSHELRTPLNAILGFSELLLDDGKKGAQDGGEGGKRRSYLGHIHNSGKHLLGLINEVLDLAKIEAGQVELNQSPFQLTDTIAGAIETVEPLAQQKGITIGKETDWAGTVFADEAKVRQILLNLLSNAIKFTPAGGRVTVASRSENSMLFLSVADNGPGIPPEDQRRIFDEFEQLESGKAVNNAGTGLGLALTRRLVELHAGRVWVESEPGQGSCFHVVLPLEPVAAESDEEEAPASAEAPPPLVLVVEDNHAAAALLSSMLRRAGYRAHVVRDGKQAVAKARELSPLAITLDVLLPGLDGWEVLRALKSTAETRDIPVVVVSVVDNRSLGIALGADDYLVKPIDREALLEAIGRHGRASRPRSRGLKVLIVDEEQETLDRLGAELQPAFSVLKARRGPEGVELARKHRPDLVLLDLVGAELTGFETVAALKSDPRTREIPVLGMTGQKLSEADKKRLNGWVDAILAQGEEGSRHLLQRLQVLHERLSAHNGKTESVSSQSRR